MTKRKLYHWQQAGTSLTYSWKQGLVKSPKLKFCVNDTSYPSKPTQDTTEWLTVWASGRTRDSTRRQQPAVIKHAHSSRQGRKNKPIAAPKIRKSRVSFSVHGLHTSRCRCCRCGTYSKSDVGQSGWTVVYDDDGDEKQGEMCECEERGAST